VQHNKLGIPHQLKSDGIKYLTYRFWLNFPALLILCGCATLDQTSKPANTVTEICADPCLVHFNTRKNNQRTSKGTIAPQRDSFHSDSEQLRVDHLQNRRHGSLGIIKNSSKNVLVSNSFNRENIEMNSQNTSIFQWTRIQYLLNDRWRLDAELPDFGDFIQNRNLSLIIPTPRLTYEMGSVKISTLFIPRTFDYRLIAVMGINLSISF
jgi:hypothetical protein